MSQEEFAAACGVHRRTQTNYELDRRRMPADYLDAIDRLGSDSVYVVSGVPVNVAPDAATFVARQLLIGLGRNEAIADLESLAKVLSDGSVNDAITGGGDQPALRRFVLSSPTVQQWLRLASDGEKAFVGELISGAARSGDSSLLESALNAFRTSLTQIEALHAHPQTARLIGLLPFCSDHTLDELSAIAFARRLPEPRRFDLEAGQQPSTGATRLERRGR